MKKEKSFSDFGICGLAETNTNTHGALGNNKIRLNIKGREQRKTGFARDWQTRVSLQKATAIPNLYQLGRA